MENIDREGGGAMRDLALDLHGLLRELDPVRFREEQHASTCARLAGLRTRIDRLLEAPDAVRPPLRHRFTEIREILRRAPAPVEPRSRWMAFREACQPQYEALVRGLRAAGARHLPSLRPTNYLRNGFHVANAVVVIAVAEGLAAHDGARIGVAIAACALAWGMELARRHVTWVNDALMRLFGGVAHPHEAHRVNSATWYTTALVILAVVFPLDVSVAALAVLGVGDPAAALVGRRFGRTPIVAGRSLEGSLAFVVAGTGAALGVLALLHPAAFVTMLLRALVAAVAGALAELFAHRIDDNLAIPVAAAVAGVLLRLLGG